MPRKHTVVAAAAAGAAAVAYVLWRRAKRRALDPHKFLEDVLGRASMAWVEARNAETVAAVGDPKATATFERILGILDAKDKIPHINRIGHDGKWYNFWQDDVHVQGIWRRTTLACISVRCCGHASSLRRTCLALGVG